MSNQSDHSEHSFFPYREQEKEHGSVPIPEYTQLENEPSPPASHVNTDLGEGAKRLQQIKKYLFRISIGLIGVLVILFICIYAYNSYKRAQIANSITPTPIPSPSATPFPTATPTPTLFQPQFPDPQFQAAYEQTTMVSTAKIAFIGRAETTVLNTEEDQKTELASRSEGYLVGSAVDDTMQTELRITYIDDETRNASFRQILVGDHLYLQQSSATDLWKQRERSDYNRLYENQPLDATAYAYNMLDTLFSSGKTFLRAIEPSSIEQQEPRQVAETELIPYTFVMNISRYLETLRNDPNANEYIVEDAERILANATVRGRIYLNPDTGYIERIEFIGENFTQISSEEAQELGIQATHTMQVLAILSDFNEPLEIVPPPVDSIEESN
ncbi:MAG: hypothetical protein ACOCXQ_03725 [Patescibacteria group bacterium]